MTGKPVNKIKFLKAVLMMEWLRDELHPRCNISKLPKKLLVTFNQIVANDW